jgi:hypothetical protein
MDESAFAKNILEGVEHPMQWKYRMHILRAAHEDTTRKQIFAELRDYLVSIGNMSQMSFIENVEQPDYDGPIIYRNYEEEQEIEEKSSQREANIYKRKEKEIDYSVTAEAQVKQLKFWNAYQSYKRDIRIRSNHSTQDKYYEKRAALLLLLDEYRKAYCIAKKAEAYELMTVLSFVQGDFRNVISLFDNVTMHISSTPVTVVSRYELFHMIGFSFLANWDFYGKNNELFDELMSFLEADGKYINLMNALVSFSKREYKDCLKSFQELSMLGYLSLYICVSWRALVANINKNIAAHCVTPYSTMTIMEINAQTGLSSIDLPLILAEAIGDGYVSGRVDVVDNVFIAKPGETFRSDRKIIDAAENLKTMINEGLWKVEVYKEATKMANK